MLYRKYRPQTFSQVVGQEHVIKTLKGALTTGRVGHAYLFCGPRGTGKTTIARLLAKSLNCDKRGKDGDCDNSCSFCSAINENRSLDLIEIDAASNRGIDEIRSLKESAMVAAPGGKYKIFIIDEVHMLTKDAFNALLKTLEEPPSHVVFVLATTEPHKILATVLSRVQRFDLKRLNPRQIFGKLKQMAKAEKIDMEEEGLTAIAMSSDGALRDAEVSLSKVIASHDRNQKISVNDVYNSLGLIPLNYYPEFLGYLAVNDKNNALDLINKAYAAGIDIEHFASGFVEYLRKILMHTINPAVLASVGEELLEQDIKLISTHSQALSQQQLIRMLNVFVSAKEGMKSSPIPQLPLELAVLELIK
ncbi:MAG: DNA polymerase III subunit gamma/tau [Candidatus Taylorbacteria bacterium]|nr:DNA polymerase III subunit gamma/tau [Candidatus Taylorbacteria bacterium]